MSIDATRWAWQAPVKKAAHRLVLLSLADRAGENYTCFPSIGRITKDTCLDRKTIMTAITQLIEMGLLEDTGHRKGTTNKVVVYRLIGVIGREDEALNSTKNGTTGTVPKTEQYQKRNSPENPNKQYRFSHETVPYFPLNSTKNGTQNLKGTKKESKKNINTKFSFESELKNLGANDQLIQDWVTVRKSKNGKDTKTAFDGFLREFQKSGLDLDTVLRICIEKNWLGFNTSWLGNLNIADYQISKQAVQSNQPPKARPIQYGQAINLGDKS